MERIFTLSCKLCLHLVFLKKKNSKLLLKIVHFAFLQMTLTNANSAIYLENIISQRDLSVFIFGCKEDELLLSSSSRRLNINSCTMSEEEVNMLFLKKNFGFLIQL